MSSMLDPLKKITSHSIVFFKENPQILYTTFLLIVIPIAFLVSGQQFLDVAQKNQERLEKERIGLMQDVFASILREGAYFETVIPQEIKLRDSFLQNVLSDLQEQNPSLEAFRVAIHRGGENIIIASLNTGEVGEDDSVNKALYQTAGLEVGQSFIFEDYIEGVRHWKAVRALTDMEGDIRGFVFLDTSMAYIDDITARNIRSAYIILFGIIFFIVLLLLRQAKVVDYAILYRKLKDVDQMKDDFVSMAAHELRTPLAIIKGYIGMISTERLTDEEKEDISRVNISVDGLNNLVGDILDVVKMEQGSIHFDLKEIDISAIAKDVTSSLQTLAKEKNLPLSFVSTSSSHIIADQVRIKQALINIIGNAIKYTPSGSVTVMVDREKGRVSIRVRDTGIGISAEDQKRLFGKFIRIRSKETEDIRGTGLGLWITLQIVSGMGGLITVESIKGKGSDFILSFPIASKT